MISMFKHCFKAFILSLLLVGCVVTVPPMSQNKVKELALLLQSLDRTITHQEAMRLSKDIFHHTQKLTEEFELTSPPQFHNFLVTIGVREKGLCYHWSDALYTYLTRKPYPAFEFHLVGANIGEYFYEHNALVVTAKGGDIKKGIIIDPWRDSGSVYYAEIEKDTAYRWVHRPKRGCD